MSKLPTFLSSLLAAIVVVVQPQGSRAWLVQGVAAVVPVPGCVATSQTTSTGSATVGPLVTTSTNNLIVIEDGFAQGGQTISSITSSPSGLTVTKRAAQSAPTGVGDKGRVEIWTAPASAVLTGETFTINYSGAVGGSAVVAFCVPNLTSIASPFDSNASLPTLGSGSGSGGVTPSISGLSTTGADTVLLFFDTTYTSSIGDPGAAPTGFTLIGKTGTTNAPSAPTYAYYKTVTATQSSLTISDGNSWASGGSSVNWAAIGDALVW